MSTIPADIVYRSQPTRSAPARLAHQIAQGFVAVGEVIAAARMAQFDNRADFRWH